MRAPRLSILLLTVVALSCASPVYERPEADNEVRADTIHSDLPLFRSSENMWPQPFDYEGSFGCFSRVAFGDWVVREQNGEDSAWFRVENYGAFHCFALVGRASERRQLEGAERKPSFFVFLGAAENGRELWVIQVGTNPGSEYILLSRPPSEGPIETFEVLQAQCPSANVRDAGSLGIILTRYCALNTQADLVRLARQMAHLPTTGTLSLIPIDSANPH